MILFTADYHIKLGQKNVPRQWAVNRFLKLFKLLNEVECDLHIVGGDILDRVPTLDELELFFKFVSMCNKPTIIYDGNHCATRKNHTFLSVLTNVVKEINSNVTIVTEVTEYDFGTILPYCCLHKKDVFKGLNKTKPLFTHVRGEIPPHVKPEIDLDLLSEFPIVYAGDLHSHSNTQRNIIYPGSPITTSFHRSVVDTGYILLNGVEWSWHKLDVPQLIRKTVLTEEEMVETEYHHTIYEIEGNVTELAKVKNSELLDKKLVKRSSDAALILTANMSILDELVEYLRYILELDDKEIERIVRVYNDNITQS